MKCQSDENRSMLDALFSTFNETLWETLVALGVEPAEIRIVGDGADEVENALRGGLDRDLLVTSGGLGPTHDDRTVELVARVAGRVLRVDEELASQIEARSRALLTNDGAAE